MTRRAWWLVALNILIPGSAQLVAGNRRLGRFGVGATFTLWLLGAVAPWPGGWSARPSTASLTNSIG